MSMEIKKITDPAFRKYGRIIEGVDFTELLDVMAKEPCPDDVIYVASAPELEALPVFEVLQTKIYGEMPIEIGYCNGHNTKLNAFEYHRDSGRHGRRGVRDNAALRSGRSGRRRLPRCDRSSERNQHRP